MGAKAEDLNEVENPNANELLNRPLHGLDCIQASILSAEALAIFTSSAIADDEPLRTFKQKRSGGVVGLPKKSWL